MRRNYLNEDFIKTPINGTFNMRERKNPLSSKMMDIEDIISIKNEQIIYYQNINNEQLDLNTELLLTPITYSPIDSKQIYNQIIIDQSQTDYDKNNLTKWNINIDLKSIIIDYIFANIKRARTFEFIFNSNTKFNSVDLAIKQYIELNLLSRYRIKDIKLYLSYVNLNATSNLRYKANWNYNIVNDFNLNKKVNIQYSYGKDTAILSFSQDRNSKEFSFDYYFDLILERA